MGIHFIRDRISRTDLQKIADERFGDMVKAVVDLTRRVMTLGGELHADEESEMLEQGSMREDLWGINLYPGEKGDAFIEYDSMINIRPALGNRTRSIDDEMVRAKIRKFVDDMITD